VSAQDSFAERLAGFDEHWRRLHPELERIEAARRRALVFAGLLLPLAVVVFLVGTVLFADLFGDGPDDDGGMVIAAFLAAGLVGLAFHLAYGPPRRAGTLIKTKVVGFLGLSYESDAGGFPVGEFERHHLLPHHTSRVLQDLIVGEIGGVPVQLCDAKLTERRRRGKHTETVTVFRGPLLIARFPKRAEGRTLVVPDGGAIGNFFNGLSKGRGERVRLESAEFEREFQVYSSDQIEARYLLTPTMMERLVALKKRFGSKLSLAFIDQQLLIALDDGRDWFPDPGLFQRLTDPAVVHEQAEEIGRLAEIVETLRLNARTLA